MIEPLLLAVARVQTFLGERLLTAASSRLTAGICEIGSVALRMSREELYKGNCR